MARQELALMSEPTALLQCCAKEPFAFLLDGGDSNSWGSGLALFGLAPRATLRVNASGEAIVRHEGVVERWRGDPFELLMRFRDRSAQRTSSEPRAGGTAVALSYDLGRWVERLPAFSAPEPDTMVLYAGDYDWLLTYSYEDRRYSLAARNPATLAPAADLLQRRAAQQGSPVPPGAAPKVTAELDRSSYRDAVSRALAYIAAGDIYQVNYAHRFCVHDPLPPDALFAAMRRDPAPFAGYMDCGDHVLVSNSPECFLQRRGDRVATFPIKGTRGRSADAATDAQLAAQLDTDAKECAEHVMIVDLERNDLGRVCRTGSVRVEELGRVHSFASVHHMVSAVVGELRPNTSLATLLRATFPGGSVTGAPKIRAMEIIDELETVPRSFYTGAMGFIDDTGDMTLNLTIRTAVYTPQGLTYHAGGGIVADSVAEREYEETFVKAEPLFRALSVRRQECASPGDPSSKPLGQPSVH
jgi:para-aminobenzoate synthetase component 1